MTMDEDVLVAPDGAESAGGAEAPAPVADEAGANPWREVPEPARVAAALEWLDALGAGRGDRRGAGGVPPEVDAARGWWLRLTSRSAEKLDTLWRERPGTVSWFGNRAARDLLAGRRRVRTRMTVTSSGMDWLSVRAEWEAEGLALTDADLARLRSAREPFVRLSGGWVRREDAGAHDAVAIALADLGLEADGREQKLSLWQLAQARDESFAVLADSGADTETLATLTRIRETLGGFAGIPQVPLPQDLVATLRPYQKEGLDFLVWTSSLGLGAVLADDMGLGKTVQALAWLEHLRTTEPGGGPTLVVCPASVAHNWAREAARFTPKLRVLVLASGRERRVQLQRVTEFDLVVTNYALLRRDIAHWREVDLRAAVLDEAQNIKNPDAAVARAARELRARHRIALTGTPLENRALDLWSILAFVNPGLLGPRARFVDRYDKPDAPPHVRRLLAARLRPVLLRRLKEQVERDLPARIEERLDCELTPGQRKLYLAELARSRQLLDALVEKREDVAKSRVIILSVLTRLRQICCHPALVGGELAAGSGKLDALFELLEPLLAEGQKVLVFSQFVRALDLIADRMKAANLPFHVLTGATPTREREKVVAAFSEAPEPCVFLVSLKAGGTGLNLTAASHVVLFDPWWNPAVEAQAIDRTHRIGQTRAVVAYRLYAEGTVEERIAELQQRKAALARDVLGEDGFARTLTREDLSYLLSD
jgi:SNF2 family DNA or RNA helicase